MRSAYADVRLFVFIFPKGCYGSVCEIELSDVGKNNGNPSLVCENIRIHQECEGGWDRGSPIGGFFRLVPLVDKAPLPLRI